MFLRLYKSTAFSSYCVLCSVFSVELSYLSVAVNHYIAEDKRILLVESSGVWWGEDEDTHEQGTR